MKLRRLSLGASAIAFSSAVKVLVQVAVLPIIGHALGPHVYGQLALVAPFVFFSMMIAESGLGACIVRAAEVTPALEGTIFCFSASLSMFFLAVFALLAYPLGRYLNEPMFPALLMGMSAIMILASFNIVPAALLLRAKKYNWIAASDITSSVGSLAGVGLGIALGWGAWSLVAQQVVLWVCKVATVTMGAKSRPRFSFSWAILKESMRFGSRVTAGSIITFFARNTDNLLIGRFLGTQALGFYALAFQIVQLPEMIIAGSVYYTLFVGTSEAVREGRSSKPQFLGILRGIMLVGMPMMAGMAATANLSVPWVMGDQWLPSVRLLVLLSPQGLSLTVWAAMAGVLYGLGRADTLFRAEAISSGATILAILATARLGSDAVAIGVSLTALILPAFGTRVIARECGIAGREFLKAAASPVASALLMGGGVAALQYLLPADLPRIAALATCVLAGMVIYAASLLLLFRDNLAEDIAEIRQVMRR